MIDVGPWDDGVGEFWSLGVWECGGGLVVEKWDDPKDEIEGECPESCCEFECFSGSFFRLKGEFECPE